jgi:hypothetical protein
MEDENITSTEDETITPTKDENVTPTEDENITSTEDQKIRPRIEGKIGKIRSLRCKLEEQERIEALRLAKLIALTSLPARPTDAISRSKVLRLGQDFWAKVTIFTPPGHQLPFGQDRIVLAGIMHLAIKYQSPVVLFDHACDLLKMFEISTDGRSYERLHERLNRVSKLAISIEYAFSKEELKLGFKGKNLFVIQEYMLPSRQEVETEIRRQLAPPGVYVFPKRSENIYGVVLGADFWEYLKDTSNQLIVPVELLQLFTNEPMGWDYVIFLVARCGAAKRKSTIDHDTLMTLFKESPKERDSETIKRLQRYHQIIMQATDNHLNATLRPAGSRVQQGRGRKKQRWQLAVGPSIPLFRSKDKPE